VFCIFLVELGLGVLARNLPQMNMFAMGIPVKIVVGLSALSLWMTSAGSVTSRIYASIFQTWNAMFGGAQ
jgi:flagellar biosynthetic protein FliR